MNTSHSTSSNKWTSLILQVLTNERLPFFPFHHVSNWQVLTNEQFLQSFYNCLISVIPRMSGQELSPKGFVFIKLSLQTNATVDNHFPQWNYIIPKRSRIPFPPKNLGIPLLFLIPVKSPLSSFIHDCITSISPAFHNILGQKLCTLYLSLFGLSN